MSTTRIGASGPQFGTIDETAAIFENVEVETSVEETELMDGDGDVIAVDQHTKRVRVTGETTYKAAGSPQASDVGSGSEVTINGSDSDINQACYLRTFALIKSKLDYRRGRFEGTSWPDLGS